MTDETFYFCCSAKLAWEFVQWFHVSKVKSLNMQGYFFVLIIEWRNSFSSVDAIKKQPKIKCIAFDKQTRIIFKPRKQMSFGHSANLGNTTLGKIRAQKVIVQQKSFFFLLVFFLSNQLIENTKSVIDHVIKVQLELCHKHKWILVTTLA